MSVVKCGHTVGGRAVPEMTLESLATEPAADTARAAFFVRVVQGTMAMEGQAVDADAERRLLQQAERLVADPRQVWDDR